MLHQIFMYFQSYYLLITWMLHQIFMYFQSDIPIWQKLRPPSPYPSYSINELTNKWGPYLQPKLRPPSPYPSYSINELTNKLGPL